jgi:hypothetical protein
MLPEKALNVKPSMSLFAATPKEAVRRNCFYLRDDGDPSIQVSRREFEICCSGKMRATERLFSKITQNRTYIRIESHLTEEEVALYVDALVLDRQD